MANGKKAIEVGQFVTVQTSEYAADYGVKKKDVLYVAGDAIQPTSKDDPYALRRILLCARVDKDGTLLHEQGCITIDGLKLKGVTKPKQERLEKQMQQLLGDPEDEATS